MVSAPVRMAGLGRGGRSDLVSAAIEAAIEIGADAEFIIEDGETNELDRGLIDWRGFLDSRHWLLMSSSAPLGSESMKSAWASALTFAELEGCKTAMIVDVPEDPQKIDEAWGSVIERIRQINLLFLSPEAIKVVSELEKTVPELLLDEIRERGLVPLVSSFDPVTGVARVSHSMGREVVKVGCRMGVGRWLAGFLCGLPQSRSGSSGIASAAMSLSL